MLTVLPGPGALVLDETVPPPVIATVRASTVILPGAPVLSASAARVPLLTVSAGVRTTKSRSWPGV